MKMIATEVKEDCSVSENSLLNEMRESRQNANVAFITFCNNYARYPKHVFCFFEGEDAKYYNQRISTVVGDDIISIKAGNKRNTLKAWRKISKDSIYDSISKMFFVDRDMDDLPEDLDGNLYVTPCYSIENLYVSKKVFAKIIQSEFSICKIDKDYEKCINLFDDLYQQFCDLMVEFNALVLIRKKKNLGEGKVCLSGINTKKMISINLSGISKGRKYDSIISDLKGKLQATDEELESAIETIRARNDHSNNFRGKNQLDFLVTLITLLKAAHRDKTFFEETKTSVSINLTDNRLSELSQYARTPDSLNSFLQNHKPQ